jgi:hypothetical protein
MIRGKISRPVQRIRSRNARHRSNLIPFSYGNFNPFGKVPSGHPVGDPEINESKTRPGLRLVKKDDHIEIRPVLTPDKLIGFLKGG